MDYILPKEKDLRKRTSKDWRKAGEKNALKLFKEVSSRVPAYKDFLAKNNINPKHIKKIESFQKLPIITKDNYLTKYPLAEMFWDGDIGGATNFSVSSGSTGEPFFWPLNIDASEIGKWYTKMILRDFFEIDKYSTLAVVSYTMGTWMAGTYMTKIFNELSESGLNLCVVSPGISKQEALRAIQRLSPQFDQTVLLGYPPFVKDLIDEGEVQGINWKKMKIRMMYGGEGFNESWREYVLAKVGCNDPYTSAINKYAASDAGIMAVETPSSIYLRKIFEKDHLISEKVFGNERNPSLQQYNPEYRYLESDDDYLVLTTNDAIPLIRYNIRDTGGIFEFDNVETLLGSQKIVSALDKVGAPISKMPFVYVFGRNHNTATIYAVNIYPENIKAALEDLRIRHLVTGKFKMITNYTKKMDQDLHLVIELSEGTEESKTLLQKVMSVLLEIVRSLNSEFNKLIEVVGERAYPSIEFLPNGDSAFAPGAKLAKVAKATKH